MKAAGIESVIGVLDEMSDAGIIGCYAVGGAFAATLHNEPIATVDLDIFFLLTRGGNELILSLSEIYDYAASKGFSFDHEFINIHGWLVQFVESSRNDLWKEAVEKAKPIQVLDTEIPVITPEYLVAMWLLAGRQKDYQKIAVFTTSGMIDSATLSNILERHDLLVKWETEKWRFTDDSE